MDTAQTDLKSSTSGMCFENHPGSIPANREQFTSRIIKYLQHKEITEHKIGAAFKVHRVLGNCFLEKIYQRAKQQADLATHLQHASEI